jgi:hypothetical protein
VSDLGIQLREQGIANSERTAGQRWQDEAIECVKIFKDIVPDFTCDEVRLWASVGGLEVPPEARAWGAVMRRAAKEGLIVPTDRFRASTDPFCHRSPARVWVSM